MWLRAKLAFRNTFRNQRRTFINILMISSGVCAMLVLEGFIHRIVTGLRETTIQTQTGHLQIASKRYWKKNAKTAKETLLLQYQKWIPEIKKNPHVKYAVGHLKFYCLVSKSERSLSAQGVSFDPKEEAARSKAYHYVKGRGLKAKRLYEISVGVGLAKKLNLRTKDRVTLLAQTMDGVVNAIDVEVSGIFQTAIAEFDDASFLIPLTTAQSLLDTQGVEQIIVGLNDTKSTSLVQRQIMASLSLAKKGVEIKPWDWLATLYHQVSEFNRIQNVLFKIIIFSLIGLSILNTVGNSIAERTSEIGTIRALGETKKSVIVQFILEGLILGVMGAVSGIFLGIMTIYTINFLRIPIMMPGATAYFYLEIDLIKESVAKGMGLAVIASVTAALLPALRAARMNIVEALRRSH